MHQVTHIPNGNAQWRSLKGGQRGKQKKNGLNVTIVYVQDTAQIALILKLFDIAISNKRPEITHGGPFREQSRLEDASILLSLLCIRHSESGLPLKSGTSYL